MKVRVRMFGALAEAVGADERVLELAEGATAGDVVDAVAGSTGLAPRLSVAVNLETAPRSRRIREGDEVALMPPVAGGDVAILVGLRAAGPRVEEALDAVAAPGAGGTAVFVGTVRDESDGRAVERLEYSAYPDMAERTLREVAEEAAAKWGLLGVAVLHGVGRREVGEPTVVVACSAPHRAEALEACRHVVDEVKRRAPIWKKERGPWGERWIGL